jgi:hypothetical protein
MDGITNDFASTFEEFCQVATSKIQSPMSLSEYFNLPEEIESDEVVTDEKILEAIQTIDCDKDKRRL